MFGKGGIGTGRTKPGGMGLGREGAASLSFSDLFTRGDGSLGNGWTGTTWTIASGKAINTPTLGAEQTVNGTMELDSDWGNSGTPTTNERSGVQKHAGSYSRHVIVDAADEGILNTAGGTSQGAGTWISGGVWLYGNNKALAPTLYNGSAYAWQPATVTPTTAWALYAYCFQMAANSNTRARVRSATGVADAEFYADDFTAKPITQSSLFAYRNVKLTGQNVTATSSVFNAGLPMGIVANVKSDGSAGVAAWIDGTNIKCSKWVGTTWTSLISVAQAPAAGVLPQLKTHRNGANLLVDLYYNGTQKGTQQTVSDAEIIDNTYAGMFSTYSTNQFASFAFVPY